MAWVIVFILVGNQSSFCFFFFLKYSWFTTLCQFLLYSKVTQNTHTYLYRYMYGYIDIHTYIHSLFYIIVHHGLSQETRHSSLCNIYSRTSLLIHSKCNSLYLLTLNSPSILLPPSGIFLTWKSDRDSCTWSGLSGIVWCRPCSSLQASLKLFCL